MKLNLNSILISAVGLLLGTLLALLGYMCKRSIDQMDTRQARMELKLDALIDIDKRLTVVEMKQANGLADLSVLKVEQRGIFNTINTIKRADEKMQFEIEVINNRINVKP